MWFQFDWGDGPARGRGDEDVAVLRLAGLEPVPGGDPRHRQDTAHLIACIDQTLRRFGGVPTYALTDNERTVTTDHVARIAMRHPLNSCSWDGTTGSAVATCVVRRPRSRREAPRPPSGSPRPTSCPPRPTCLPAYTVLRRAGQAACEAFGHDRSTPACTARPGAIPDEMLAEERHRAAPVSPSDPYSAVLRRDPHRRRRHAGGQLRRR
jgi:hypothetical protein